MDTKVLSTLKNHKIIFFPILLFILIIPLTLFKIHGSSVGMYNHYFYGSGFEDDSLLYGNPRGIRSDEWFVQTPWTLIEYQVEFSENNSLIAGGQNFTVTEVPVLNWTISFKPQNWSFFVFPIEEAFAFKWWFRSFLFLLASYLFFLRLSKGHILVSILASLAFLYSPFFQWWYSTSFIDLTTYSLFIIFFFMRMIKFKFKRILFVDSALFVYFALSFAILLYPPSQVTLALFFVAFGIAYILHEKHSLNPERIKTLSVAFIASITAIFVVLLIYYFSFNDVLDSMLNSSYPGDRRVTGGDLQLGLFLGGPYNIQLLDDYKQVPTYLFNQSEASSFLMYSFFLLPVFIFGLLKEFIQTRKIDVLLLTTLAFYIFALVWSFFGLPSVIAKITLLNFVSPRRMMHVFGVINIVLIFYYLFRHKTIVSLDFKIFAAVYSFCLFAFYAGMGKYLIYNFPLFIQSKLKVALIAFIFAFMLFLLLLRKKNLFFLLFLLFTAFSSYRINPLYRGLSPILDSELSEAVDRINQEDENRSVWVVYDSLILGNYLAANGVTVANGTRIHPDLEYWQNFDPDSEYLEIYNRYSHTVFEVTEGEDVAFELRSPDTQIVHVNPCSDELFEENIKFYVFTRSVNYSCLQNLEVVKFPNLEVTIYERTK